MIEEELTIDIISHGVDVDLNEPWDNGQTPLHFASMMGMAELIQAMLELHPHALDLFAVTDDFLVQFNDFQCGGKTALHYAAMNGAIDVCKLLIEFERDALKTNRLLFVDDRQGNDALFFL